MLAIAVIEEPTEKVSSVISSRLRLLNMREVTLLGRDALAYGATPSLLLLSPFAAGRRPERGARPPASADTPPPRGAERGRELSCELLLTPGNCPTPAWIHADRRVSYGMSERDTLTLSSIDGDAMVVTLQRELSIPGGRVLERQDIPMRRESGATPEIMLAAAGALLAAGVTPSDLSPVTGLPSAQRRQHLY